MKKQQISDDEAAFTAALNGEWEAISDADKLRQELEAARLGQQKTFFEREAKRSSDLYMGFAQLFLGKDLESANKHIRAAYDRMFKESAEQAKVKDATEMTPEIAGADRIKWQMRTWVRIHLMFSDSSNDFPSRLSKENQELIEDLFWNFQNNSRNQQ